MNHYNIISFPGLGIDSLRIRNTAFTLFGFEVKWYGLLLTLGIVLAYLYADRTCKRHGFTSEDVLDYALFAIPLAVIGARTYYVLTTLGNYDSFLDVIAIWEGGIAIYGAIIGGALALLLVTVYKKRSVRATLTAYDMAAPAVMIGQIVGRWGNFVNGECFGTATSLPWRMGIVKQYPSGYTVDVGFVHPTFLYESLWNLIGFLLLDRLARKKQYEGQIFYGYIAWYGFGRMLVEGLRTDSLYVGPFRISQVVGLACFLVGGFFFAYNQIKLTRQKRSCDHGDQN